MLYGTQSMIGLMITTMLYVNMSKRLEILTLDSKNWNIIDQVVALLLVIYLILLLLSIQNYIVNETGRGFTYLTVVLFVSTGTDYLIAMISL